MASKTSTTTGSASCCRGRAAVIPNPTCPCLNSKTLESQVNLGWHPKAEQMLWQPSLQAKRSQNGALNVRDTWQAKQRYLDQFLTLLADRAPSRHLPDS